MNKIFTIKRLFYFWMVSIFFFCSCFLTGCVFQRHQKPESQIARERITRLTGIKLPSDSEIVYHVRDKEDSFIHGRRFMYTVFRFESEPTNWFHENSFQAERSDEFERYFSGGFAFFPEEMGEIPQEFLPNFEDKYLWLKAEKGIHFVYAPQNLLLFVQIPGY